MQKYVPSLIWGLVAALALLAFYAVIVSLVSGVSFMTEQFNEDRLFIFGLALGFGIQVGLYRYLKNVIANHRHSGRVVAASGTTSTVAMISCCAHYAVNLAPLIGISGALAILGQYQTELFWLGLAANATGIIFMVHKLISFHRQYEHTQP